MKKLNRKRYRDLFTTKRSKQSNMFPFISDTDNPIGGYCYGCEYCYIHGLRGMKKRFKRLNDKYSGDHRLFEKNFEKIYGDGKFVFVCDCIDIFHSDVPDWMIRRVLEWIGRCSKAMFLLLTKNPRRFFDFKDMIPPNVCLGLTVESNYNYKYGNAPLQDERLKVFAEIHDDVILNRLPRLISAEPVLDFDPDSFFADMMYCLPDCVAIGYDNHKSKLIEPYMKDVLKLISMLEKAGIIVIRKTIREKWDFTAQRVLGEYV